MKRKTELSIEKIWTNRLNAIIAVMKQERKGLPKGILVVNRQPKGIVFYMKKNGKPKGITRKKELVHLLARRTYLDRKIKEMEEVEKQLRIISAAVKTSKGYIEDLSDTKLDIDRVRWSPQQIAGIKKGGMNPYEPEERVYMTRGGVYMRSKSERDIGNIYEEFGIPYAYECRLSLEVTAFTDVKGARVGSGGRLFKDYYPDFTIFLADGTFIVHEHLGRVDLEEYRAKAGEKLMAMTMNGISPDRLILTYEDDLKDISKLRRMLAERVVPFI